MQWNAFPFIFVIPPPTTKKSETKNKPGKSFAKAQLSAEYQPYAPYQLTSSGAEYKAEASKDPLGWSNEDIIMALSHGYSKTGLRNLRPNSRCWTLGSLLDNRATHAPDVLDPRLNGFQAAYAAGYTDEPLGYMPNAALTAKRAKLVSNQSPKPVTNSAD